MYMYIYTHKSREDLNSFSKGLRSKFFFKGLSPWVATDARRPQVTNFLQQGVAKPSRIAVHTPWIHLHFSPEGPSVCEKTEVQKNLNLNKKQQQAVDPSVFKNCSY